MNLRRPRSRNRLLAFVATGLFVLGCRDASPSRHVRADAAPTTTRTPPSPTPPTAAPSPRVSGYVWSEVRRRGRTVQRIVPTDLMRRIGSRGWHGCPADGICTRYGQLTLELDDRGGVELAWNAKTSSDFARRGRFVEEEAAIRFELSDAVSCAHPAEPRPAPRSIRVFARREVDTLELAMRPPSRSPWPLEEPVDAGTTIVFRRLSREVDGAALRFRACAREDATRCDARCSSLDDLLRRR